MRPRAQSYRTLDGLANERDEVPWYWKLLAAGSSFMILGGYLMLPATWEKDANAGLRIKSTAVGIFALILLIAGLSLNGLVCFAVRNPLFQRDALFTPALISSALGLLTIFYNFLIFTRYHFNIPAILTTIAAASSSALYALLLLWCRRRLTTPKAQSSITTTTTTTTPSLIPLQTQQHRGSESENSLGQQSSYYENYTRNMFPSAYSRSAPSAPQITEDEMQRQQMLMLLLQHAEQPQAHATPNPSAGTFHIDWQGREDEELPPPANGYYAPQAQRPAVPGIVRSTTSEMMPWDGVWREPGVGRTARLRRSREEVEGVVR